jgi:antibiotic biosynthesis monooxygenase (ABM) superfamily enzyme
MRNDSKGNSPDRHDWLARAAEALEKARRMKPGAQRNEALKKAGQLQTAADFMGYLKSKELRPPK